MLGAVCTHVTPSALSRDSAAKLTTDSYQFWVAHLNMRVTFQSHNYTVCKKSANYGDAFSMSSSIVKGLRSSSFTWILSIPPTSNGDLSGTLMHSEQHYGKQR